MAVADFEYKFIFTNSGQTGRNSDSTVFSRTSLCQRLSNGLVFEEGKDYHLIADAAFPMQTWLMKPYIENENTPDIQRFFNYRLSSARMVIEGAFGRLKGRWRSLQKVRFQHSKLCKMVNACVIFHNICETHKHEYFEQWEDDDPNILEVYAQPECPPHNSLGDAAKAKRDRIAMEFFTIE